MELNSIVRIRFCSEWKSFPFYINNNQINSLLKGFTFAYDDNTTIYELLKYTNKKYRSIVSNLNKSLKDLDKEDIVKNNYRLCFNNSYVYLYDLNTRIIDILSYFNSDEIIFIYTFFLEIGGRLDTIDGLDFYMHSKENGKHHLPHMHVRYNNQEVVISLTGEILDGSINSKKQKRAIEIIKDDRESFLLKWNTMTDGDKFVFNNFELVRFI